MAAKGKIFKRGQCAEFVRRGQPYVICFSTSAAAKAFRRARSARRTAEAKRMAKRLGYKDLF